MDVHENKLLGALALAFMAGMTFFVSPRHGWLALAVITMFGSIWGLVYGEKIRLKYFGQTFWLGGKTYKLYCLTGLLIGLGILWHFFATAP